MAGKHGEGSSGRSNKGGQNGQDDRGFWASAIVILQMFLGFIINLLPRRGVPEQVPLRMVAGREGHRRQLPEPPRAVVFRRHQQEVYNRFVTYVRITLLAIYLSQQDGRGRIFSIIALGVLVFLYRVGVIPPFPWFAQEWEPPVNLWPDVEPDDRNEHPGREGNPGHEE